MITIDLSDRDAYDLVDATPRTGRTMGVAVLGSPPPLREYDVLHNFERVAILRETRDGDWEYELTVADFQGRRTAVLRGLENPGEAARLLTAWLLAS